MELKERFLKYVGFDTQSSYDSQSYPSTDKQLVLLKHLLEEMREIGLHDTLMDEYGYVMGTIPATPGYESAPVIGLIAHVDTSPDMSGADIKPQIIPDYDGKDIALGNSGIVMKVDEFPELTFYKGHTLITTDGTTLLGADDKAGIAEIMTAAEYLIRNPQIAHGKIRIGFTPDEEVGCGVDHFDVEKFGAKYAYTVDGGFEGELEYENFNAAGVKIKIQGRNIHPGYAKDKMLNAMHLACELNAMLPPQERPEHTEKYEGFYHLTAINGQVEQCSMEYIIRDHSYPKFEKKKEWMTFVCHAMNKKYGQGTIEMTMKDQYYNMREVVEPHKQVIDKAVKAMEMACVVPLVRPIRGGTDGSRLSYMNLPCPNLFTGGMNFHGKYEYCSLDTMERSVQTLLNLVQLWAEK